MDSPAHRAKLDSVQKTLDTKHGDQFGGLIESCFRLYTLWMTLQNANTLPRGYGFQVPLFSKNTEVCTDCSDLHWQEITKAQHVWANGKSE